MDPEACLERLLKAIENEEWDEAEWAASDLCDWLEHGGFPPQKTEKLIEMAMLPDMDVKRWCFTLNELLKERQET